MTSTIHTLRFSLQETMRDLGIQFYGVRGDRSKPVGYASILLRYEDTDLELAFGRRAGVPCAQLFVLDGKGIRTGRGWDVGASTLADLLDALTTPPEEARLRVEAALKGLRVERTRSGLKVSRPSPDGPGAPDVVYVRNGRVYSPAGHLLATDTTSTGLERAWDRLVTRAEAARLPEVVELSAQEVRGAGIDPGPSRLLWLVQGPDGLELWAALEQ